MNSRTLTKENPSEHVPRLPATRRVKKSKLPPFRLTPRDREVVKAVYTHRALTTPQIEALLFPPENGQDHSTKTSRVRYRLKMLFQHGYLFRDEQPTKLSEGRKPLVYFIDQQAVPLLAEEYAVFPEDIAWKPKGNNVRWIFLDLSLIHISACQRPGGHHLLARAIREVGARDAGDHRVRAEQGHGVYFQPATPPDPGRRREPA